jgi:hypothetical protein
MIFNCLCVRVRYLLLVGLDKGYILKILINNRARASIGQFVALIIVDLSYLWVFLHLHTLYLMFHFHYWGMFLSDNSNIIMLYRLIFYFKANDTFLKLLLLNGLDLFHLSIITCLHMFRL